ncbi:phage major capsid protein, HK97 family [Rhizobiales bacterium GAS188]|nr:phage major capsid protein, HK97 family [Rhizobiales bacterium GAS188]
MDLKALRKMLADKSAAGKAKLAAYNALAGKDALSDEESTQLEALGTEIDALEAEVEKLSAQIARAERSARAAGSFEPGNDGRRQRVEIIRDQPNPETTAGFRSLPEFAVAVRQAYAGGSVDPRLMATTPPGSYNQNSGASGEGYLVPPEYRQQIWEIVFAPEGLLGAMNPEPTNSNLIQYVKDETTPWGAAGVQAYWRSEAAQMQASKAQLLGGTLPLNELYAFVSATDELLQDAPRMQNHLTDKAGQAIRWKASDAFMWGDGVGKPQGFMGSKALIVQPKETGQTTGSVVFNNITKMLSRMIGINFGALRWLASREILPDIASLQIGNIPVFTPPNAGATDAPAGYLLGRPIDFSLHSQARGTQGDLVLADFSGYMAATKSGGIDFASSIHLFFDIGLTAFRWTFRVGGQPFLSAPIVPPRGSLTSSHWVALAARP